MKKFILSLTLLTLVAMVSHASVTIDSYKFPDNVFRSYVSSNFDSNKDGVLSDSELAAVNIIQVPNKNIGNLQGIEYFTNLTYLDCSYNTMRDLFLSSLTKLRSLKCNNMGLSNLSISSSIESIDCSYNNLSGQRSFFGMTNLREINCSYNQMTLLSFKNCTNLEKVSCHHNQLNKYIDFGGCSKLDNISFEHNKILYYEISKTIQTIPNAPSAYSYIYVYESYSGEEGNEVSPKQVKQLKDKSWKVQAMSDEDHTYTFNGIGVDVDSDNFPDPIFLEYLKALNQVRYDMYLSPAEIEAFTELDLNGKGISNLKGIEHFTALTKLLVASNNLTTLDVSRNTKLQTLSCGTNKLTSLNLQGCKALKVLYCFSNQLTSLDFSWLNLEYIECYANKLTSLKANVCTYLKQLYCQDNQLTTLEVSDCNQLTTLTCNNNQLSTIDLSDCYSLKTLNCYQNKLKTLDLSSNSVLTTLSCQQNLIRGANMDNMIQSLYNRSGLSTLGVLKVRYANNSSWPEGNRITPAQVQAARNRGWYPKHYSGGWEDYEGDSTNGDVNGDGKVDVEDVNAIINIILELKTEAYYKGNADLNGDGKVDVEDVNAIINIILTQ